MEIRVVYAFAVLFLAIGEVHIYVICIKHRFGFTTNIVWIFFKCTIIGNVTRARSRAQLKPTGFCIALYHDCLRNTTRLFYENKSKKRRFFKYRNFFLSTISDTIPRGQAERRIERNLFKSSIFQQRLNLLLTDLALK